MSSDRDQVRPPRNRPRRLRAIIILPTMATLGNLLCGFFAIVCCFLALRDAYAGGPPAPKPALFSYCPTYVTVGAYLVFLSMFFDALDGRLARITRRTSEFGAQLDSISDVVSFGAAPPLMLITLLLPLAAPPDGEAVLSALQWKAAVLAVLIYVSCAAMRLARYNVENVHDEIGQKRFSGLPVPGAAAGLAALLVLHEDPSLGDSAHAWMRWTMIAVTFVLGLLMVSRVSFAHVFNIYFGRRRPPTQLLWAVIVVVLLWNSATIALVVLSYTYIIGGLVLHAVRRRKPEEAPESLEDAT